MARLIKLGNATTIRRDDVLRIVRAMHAAGHEISGDEAWRCWQAISDQADGGPAWAPLPAEDSLIVALVIQAADLVLTTEDR